MTSIVPIEASTNDKKIFENPRPSSTRYCRPLRIQFLTENSKISLAEKAHVDQQIAALKPTKFECMGGLQDVANYGGWQNLQCSDIYGIVSTLLHLWSCSVSNE